MDELNSAAQVSTRAAVADLAALVLEQGQAMVRMQGELSVANEQRVRLARRLQLLEQAPAAPAAPAAAAAPAAPAALRLEPQDERWIAAAALLEPELRALERRVGALAAMPPPDAAPREEVRLALALKADSEDVSSLTQIVELLRAAVFAEQEKPAAEAASTSALRNEISVLRDSVARGHSETLDSLSRGMAEAELGGRAGRALRLVCTWGTLARAPQHKQLLTKTTAWGSGGPTPVVRAVPWSAAAVLHDPDGVVAWERGSSKIGLAGGIYRVSVGFFPESTAGPDGASSVSPLVQMYVNGRLAFDCRHFSACTEWRRMSKVAGARGSVAAPIATRSEWLAIPNNGGELQIGYAGEALRKAFVELVKVI